MLYTSTNAASMLDLLEEAIECPLVYADMETLIACKMVERHKFSILEINENYETYVMKKDHAAEVLDSLKSSVKMQSLQQNVADMAAMMTGGEEVELSMCWGLYHLHFQFLQLFESYTKLVGTLDHVPKPSEIVDLSSTVAILRESLQRAQAELEQDNEAALMPEDASSLSREDAEKLLMECIRNEQLVKSIQLMHNLRKLFPGDMFGVNPSDEVEALLFIYCKCQADAKPGVVAIMESSRDLSEIHANLIEIKIQLSSFPRSLTSPTPLAERGEPCGCPSGVSLMPTIIKVDSTESETCPLIKTSESSDTLGLSETPDSSTL